MPTDRKIAGIRCMQVLEQLSNYLDGALDTDTVSRIEAHLRGCDWCEQFGREFAGTIKELRQELCEAEELDPAMAHRLMRSLTGNADS